MKIPTLLITIALIAMVDASSDPKLQWFPYPYPYHHHHHRGWPYYGALPPMPHHSTPYQPDPQLKKCLSHGGEIGACVGEIVTSFFARKASIGPQCCKAIMMIDDDCENTVFGHFHNPFFNAYIKQHCANQAAPTPA